MAIAGTNLPNALESLSAGRVATTGISNFPHSLPTTIDPYLTASEAANLIKVHPVTLLRWARERRVPHRRISTRKILFPLSVLTQWLAGSMYSVTPAASCEVAA